ncbi:MAG: M56 family metallopeptidase [Clostridiales bacterium]|nr:M56 family metallopeptidase [Clostridiales bacterium]
MTLLHTMGLAGSIAVIFYMLTYVFTKRYMPIAWHKIYLTITIFLYLIPFQFFGISYQSRAKKILGINIYDAKEFGLSNESNRMIYIYKDRIYVHNPWLYIFMAICILVSVCLLFYMVIKNIRLRKEIEKCSVVNEDATSIIKQLGGKGRVKVYQCSALKTPVAAGILRGKIILPDTELKGDKLQAALCHELTHINVKDNFIKICLLIVVILNFYNPLVYYLLIRWNITAELYCDKKTLAGMSEREINNYANMIIDFAEEKYNSQNTFMGLAKNAGEKQLKERIMNIKGIRRNYGKICKALGMLLIAVAVFSASLTVAAYEPRKIDIDLDKNYGGGEVTSYFRVEEDINTDIIDGLDLEGDVYIDDDLYEYFGGWGMNEFDMWIIECGRNFNKDCSIVFTDEDGGVLYCGAGIEENDENYGICSHTYVEGKVLEHVVSSDGSCDVNYYSGQKCSNCDYIVCGQLINTCKSIPCRHIR